MSEQLFNLYGFFIFIVGTCIGSFLNVVALRAFTGESIVLPPSKCPKCGAKIKPYDNIPVLSWLILGGKCRNCKNPISKQYPIVEFLTGCGFLWFYNHFAHTLVESSIQWQNLILLPFFLVIFSIAVVIAITDIKEKVVFDVHTISLAVIILLFQTFALGGNFLPPLIGLIVGALSMELLSGIGWLMVRKRAFGTGDTYIAAAMGALLGIKWFFVALVLAVILQVIFVIPSFIKKLYINKHYKVLVTGGIFFVTFFLYKLPFLNAANSIIQYVFLALLCVSGIYFCKLIVTNDSLKENPTYWPFGPCLLLSMFLVALYGGMIKHFLLSFFM